MPPVKKVTDQHDLVPTSKYPSYAKFSYETFNPVQSRVFDFYNQECNAVIAAKTSAGKTVVSEMMSAYQLREKGGKVIYLAPMKALANEKLDDWSEKDHHFGDLKIAICTGDYRLTPGRKKELEEANLIVLTSEMLNSRTRNFKSEKNEWLKDVKLCIVDEAHLLAVPGRGDHLEVGLMNLTRIAPDVRFVLLSATMPNVAEIADWVSYSLTKKDTYLLESEYRPCPLGIHYETYYSGGSYEDVEDEKINSAISIIEDHPEDRFLLFVHTKRTGEKLKKTLERWGYECEFHSADLDKDKRRALEKRFRSGNLKYLIATSTLAWGCHKKGSKVIDANGNLRPVETLYPEDKVVSYDEKTGGFQFDRIKDIQEQFIEDYLEITLSGGEKLEVTTNHEFLSAIQRKSPEWNQAECLQVGDFLAVPTKYGFSFPNHVFDFDPLAYLVGVVLGDGCLTFSGYHADGKTKNALDISFDSRDKKFAQKIRKLLEETFGKEIPEARPDKDGVLHLVTKCRDIVSYFEQHVPMGKKGDKFSIHANSKKSPKFIVNVLRGLFDTDGGLERHDENNWSVGLSSISENLIREVCHYCRLFGIKAEVGKKRMKDRIINGRLQKATREFIWRLRIYNHEINNFSKIGFNMNRKKLCMNKVIAGLSNKKPNIDLIPVRNLVVAHARKNNVSCRKMLKEFKIDKWNVLNKSEVSRNKLKEIIAKYPVQSALTKLVDSNITWKKIVKIDKKQNATFLEIETESKHNYVCDGVVSHNCNTPARRVIILGVHRGLTLVDTWDIWQMVGRSGRPGYDDRGDAYILIPESKADEHIHRLKAQQPINSRLLDNANGHYKVLAFHLVSEIHHGGIKNKEDVQKWYQKTLACFQSKDLDEKIVDSTMELLMKCGAIKEDEGRYKVTVVGMVSSMFYFSPFDVADLRRNFFTIFKNNLENSDLHVAMALGNIDSLRGGIVAKAEREEMSLFQTKVWKVFGKDTFTEAAIKGGFAYYAAMTGTNVQAMSAIMRNIQWDYPRLGQVLESLDTLGCKWNKVPFFKELQSRVIYGVTSELVPLVKLPEIGKVRAEKLWAAGIRKPADIVAKPDEVRKLLNMKAEKVLTIIEAAKKVDVRGDVLHLLG